MTLISTYTALVDKEKKIIASNCSFFTTMARGISRSDEVHDSDDDGQPHRQHKRNCFRYTIKQKIAIVQEAYSKPGFVNRFAEKKGMPHDTDIRKWKALLGNLKKRLFRTQTH
jgi:hypothetical protein